MSARIARLLIGLLLAAALPAALVAQTGALGPDPAEAAPALRAHAVTVDGHPLRVWEKSPAQPRARMLLIHGRTWSTRPDFDLQVPGEDVSLMDGLVALGIASFGVDLRGYGETPRDESGWLTPERAAADVAGVLEWLARSDPAAPPPYLFGWSYGAMVAQLVAQRYPERVAGVILFGYPVRPGIDRDPPPTGTGAPPGEPTTAEAARSDFLLPDAVDPRVVEAFAAAALAADPVRADWRELGQWRALDAAAVRVPVLLLQASHDPLARDDVHRDLFTRLATDDKAWVVIPGGDHAAFLERPRGYFLRLIEAFVYRDAPRG
ncbi:MAG TPA: alpha/beta fold hydrolase [Pseudomonadales bacterium]